MNPYIEKLNAFLASHPVTGGNDAESLLQVLRYYYTQDNPVDSALIRCQFYELDKRLSHLSLAENDSVFDLVSGLCTAHLDKAFEDGVLAGLRLYTELFQPTVSE